MYYAKHSEGFTLIELVAVLAVIGILAALAVPRFMGLSGNAESEVCAANRATINVQIERYELAGNTLADITDVTEDTDYFPDGAPTCPSDGDEYTLGANGRSSCPNHGQ